MKTYFEPVRHRRGQPIILFIDHDKMGYWLGTYYELNYDIPRAFKGIGSDYDAVIRTRIKPALYRALLKESKANHAKYKKK